MNDNDRLFEDILHQEIARELLLDSDPNITDDQITKVWSMCDGNPWDAPALWSIVKTVQR